MKSEDIEFNDGFTAKLEDVVFVLELADRGVTLEKSGGGVEALPAFLLKAKDRVWIQAKWRELRRIVEYIEECERAYVAGQFVEGM